MGTIVSADYFEARPDHADRSLVAHAMELLCGADASSLAATASAELIVAGRGREGIAVAGPADYDLRLWNVLPFLGKAFLCWRCESAYARRGKPNFIIAQNGDRWAQRHSGAITAAVREEEQGNEANPV